MRPLPVLAWLPFVMGTAPAQQPVPEHDSIVVACGWVVAPPTTLPEWRERADLVIRVKIDSQTAFEDTRTSDIMTAHGVAVLDVLKGHPRAVAAGAVQEVFQMGGRVRRSDAFYTQTWNGFPPMPIGSEWVLFLQWDARLNGFTLFYRENGAVQIVAGKVATKSSLHSAWHGKPVEEFVQACLPTHQENSEPFLSVTGRFGSSAPPNSPIGTALRRVVVALRAPGATGRFWKRVRLNES